MALRGALKPALHDLESNRSSAAYTTFFKDIAYAPYVRKIFSEISGAVAVSPDPGGPAWTPTFVCIDGLGQTTWGQGRKTIDAYHYCQADRTTPAAVLLPRPFTIICPVFFEDLALPAPTKTSCLSIDPKHPHLFAQDGGSLCVYQVWYLLHEMVHYYVWASKQDSSDFYFVNQCAQLSGREAILNAQSYIYYAASKCGQS